MEASEIQAFTQRLLMIEANNEKVFAKLENMDDRLRTIECNFIHMDERDMKSSSEIKSGLNPIRNDLFSLKTEFRNMEVTHLSSNQEQKKESDKLSPPYFEIQF